MSFLEETIGESLVRAISLTNTLMVSFVVTVVFFAQGQATTGTVLTILTGVNFLQLFSSSMTVGQIKVQCLLLQAFSGLSNVYR
jgi:hypothetical protein